MRHVDRRKCSAPINAGKPTRVTVGENVERSAGGFGKSADELQPVYTNQAALLDVGITDCGSFPKRHINSLLRLHFREHCAHSRQCPEQIDRRWTRRLQDRKSTRLNSSHVAISYAVFCLKKKSTITNHP